jgi:hypothetical protein
METYRDKKGSGLQHKVPFSYPVLQADAYELQFLTYDAQVDQYLLAGYFHSSNTSVGWQAHSSLPYRYPVS